MLHHHSNIKDIEFLEYIRSIIPLIIASNALNILKNLSIKYKTEDIRKLIFPAIIAFFVPPLVANLVYKQFIVNNTVLLSFFSAVLVFPIMIRLPFVIFFMTKFGKIGKFLFLRSLRDNKQPIAHVTLWPVLSDFIGIFLFKILSGESNFEISERKFLKTMLSGVIVFIARQLHLNDPGLFLIFLIIEILMFTHEKLYISDEKTARDSAKSLLHIFNHLKEKKDKISDIEIKSSDESALPSESYKMEQPEKKIKIEKVPVEPQLDDPFETDTIQVEEPENTSESKKTRIKRRGRPKKNVTLGSKKSVSKRDA